MYLANTIVSTFRSCSTASNAASCAALPPAALSKGSHRNGTPNWAATCSKSGWLLTTTGMSHDSSPGPHRCRRSYHVVAAMSIAALRCMNLAVLSFLLDGMSGEDSGGHRSGPRRLLGEHGRAKHSSEDLEPPARRSTPTQPRVPVDMGAARHLSWARTCPPPYHEVIEAMVYLADQHRHPLQFACVRQPPAHIEAPRQVGDGALQHHRILRADHQLTVVKI